jgi:hypothetical protein
MSIFTYEYMQDHFGDDLAYFMLVEIERAAGLHPSHSDIYLEARLTRALRAQDERAATFAIAA